MVKGNYKLQITNYKQIPNYKRQITKITKKKVPCGQILNACGEQFSEPQEARRALSFPHAMGS
jgi:hypothetical protein